MRSGKADSIFLYISAGKLFEHLTSRLPAAPAPVPAPAPGGGGDRASPQHQPPTPPHTPRAASPGQAALLEQERRRLLARTAIGGNGVSTDIREKRMERPDIPVKSFTPWKM